MIHNQNQKNRLSPSNFHSKVQSNVHFNANSNVQPSVHSKANSNVQSNVQPSVQPSVHSKANFKVHSNLHPNLDHRAQDIQPKIVITIPAYNEERTLPFVLDDIHQMMDPWGYAYQILVLNDGSRDRTAEVAKAGGAIVVSNKRNLGLAETFRVEMKECLKLGADIIIHTDADGQYHPQHIPELIEKVRSGYDLVLGSRFRGRIEKMPILKRLGNIAFSRVLSSLTHVQITDSTTGFRGFTAEVAREISFINTFTYTQEQIIRASKQGFKIAEIPIVARKTRDSRLFKSPFSYALRAWINILRIYRDYEPLAFFGRMGIFGMSIGFIIGLYFVYLHFTTGIKGHIGLLFFMLISFVFGLQTTIFGFLADMMKK